MISTFSYVLFYKFLYSNDRFCAILTPDIAYSLLFTQKQRYLLDHLRIVYVCNALLGQGLNSHENIAKDQNLPCKMLTLLQHFAFAV